MKMKLVQYNVIVVAVVLAVLAQQVFLVQMTCGPCISMNIKHRMALKSGVF